MRSLSPVLVCMGVALAAISGRLLAEGAPLVPLWAQTFLKAWYATFNGGDAAGIAKFFTVDARFGPHKGRAAIAADLKKAFAATTYRCVGHFETLDELGALAVASGVETCEETPKPSGSPVTTKERWLVVFERQVDGRWLISRETWEELRP